DIARRAGVEDSRRAPGRSAGWRARRAVESAPLQRTQADLDGLRDHPLDHAHRFGQRRLEELAAVEPNQPVELLAQDSPFLLETVARPPELTALSSVALGDRRRDSPRVGDLARRVP